MLAYLIRRSFQMILVVLLSTLAIYILLNVAPGGPLSGLRTATADRRQQVSEADIARLEAYLGINKPLILRYLCWLVGEDWLGADWLSVSLGGYRLDENHTYRFWVDPGVAHLSPGYKIWVWGEQKEGAYHAERIVAKPKGARPDDMLLEATVFEVQGADLIVERGQGDRATVRTTADTVFEIPDVAPRPQDGVWLNVGWLFNPYRGLLGRYAGYHGSQRGVLRLDWGTSWRLATGQPIVELIKTRLPNTLLLMATATVLSLLVAVPIGIISAVRQYSFLDYVSTTASFFGSAMPVFWFGLMMVLLFSYKFREWGLPFMPAGGVTLDRPAPQGNVLNYLQASPGGLLDRVVHVVMPTIVLSLNYMAAWSRFTRSSMLEVLRQDYVRTARAKGLRERFVLGKHALRNALIPLITIVVFQIPRIFGGAIITETVFAYKGMGGLYFQALNVQDWPVAMVLLLITAVLVVFATLLGDVLYTVVDPRIRLD